MDEPGKERLELSYNCGPADARESVKQTIWLVTTQPHYGGKRWWMLCPVNGDRVAKIYKPGGGNRFAGRRALRLGYQSQRETPADRKLGRLFALQEKLGCERNLMAGLQKPKRMWYQTYERHYERYRDLEQAYLMDMAAMMERWRR